LRQKFDAQQIQPCSVAFDPFLFVDHEFEAFGAELLDQFTGRFSEYVMVTQNTKDTVTRSQFTKRVDKRFDRIARGRDIISCKRNQVGFERVAEPLVAGSVIGFASEQDLSNFRTTDAAFGEVPAAFNDMLLPLNELGLLKGSRADRNQRIRDLSYGFAEGRGTTYSKLAAIDGEGAKRRWRSIALGTGEEAIDEISTAAGTTRMTGASIRWIDQPAVRQGAEDTFDRCPDEIDPADRRTWVRQLCKGLRRACRTHPGVAIKHFVERVIKNRRTIKLDLQRLTDRFVEKEVRKGDGPAIQHLAMCFGHLEAAGILGVRFKTLPWSEKVVRSCVRRCYLDARRALRTESDLLRQGLRVLRKKLDGEGMLDLTQALRVPQHALKASDGYFQKTKLGLEATIRAGRFKMWFKDPRQPAIVLRWLYAKGALSIKGTPPTKPGTGIVWAESQPQWPGGSRPRSIGIDLSWKLLEQMR